MLLYKESFLRKDRKFTGAIYVQVIYLNCENNV